MEINEHIKFLLINRDIDNPIYSKQIERIVKVEGATVRYVVRKLRQEGRWIANCTGKFNPSEKKNSRGYFLAKTWAEIEPTITDLVGRKNSLVKTIEAMTKIKQDLFT